MHKRLLTASFATLVVLAGCVTAPTGPSMHALPGSQRSLDQFRLDDVECRSYATAVLGPSAAQPANDAAAGHAVAGTLIGAAAGAIIGSASGQAGQGAAFGAGTGLLFGAAAGSNVYGHSSYALQSSFDAAYFQCMYSRGNQVPRQTAYRSLPPPVHSVPPGGYPPPNYPPPGYPPPNTPPPR